MSAEIGRMYDEVGMIVEQTKSGPAGASTPVAPGLTDTGGRLMVSLPYPFSLEEAFRRNQLALSILAHRHDPAAVTHAVEVLRGDRILDDLVEPTGDA